MKDVVVKRIVGFYSRKFSKTKMAYMLRWKRNCVQWCGVYSEQAGKIRIEHKELLLMIDNTTAVMWLMRKSECSSTLQR